MSKEVLIITGACGVGKTSTATIWASLKQGVVIEGDYIRECMDEEDFPKWSNKEEKFISKLSAMMAIEFLKNDLPVVIENVWSPMAIEFIRSELFRMRDIKVKVVWLKCDLEENHKRDQQRASENQMKERVDIVNNELNSHNWPSYIKELDTSNMSFDEVLAEIENI